MVDVCIKTKTLKGLVVYFILADGTCDSISWCVFFSPHEIINVRLGSELLGQRGKFLGRSTSGIPTPSTPAGALCGH